MKVLEYVCPVTLLLVLVNLEAYTICGNQLKSRGGGAGKATLPACSARGAQDPCESRMSSCVRGRLGSLLVHPARRTTSTRNAEQMFGLGYDLPTPLGVARDPRHTSFLPPLSARSGRRIEARLEADVRGTKTREEI